ncbi:AbfB domain-containing protein [Amycolatopsis sp. lyj-90]|uniref:AbfB domain-containing protein n=1 Tax=Amycolatopsis sp. lyj-90 TaxID=2789285 RepID=UPI00397E42A0
MRRTLGNTGKLTRTLAILTVATALTGLVTPAGASAAPPPPAPEAPLESPDATAAELPAATELEKVRAVHEIEVGDATSEWRNATDMNFVFKVFDRINGTDFPLTKEESYRVYRIMVQTPTAPDATAFIRTGVFDFAARDRIERQRRQDAWNETVRVRREALIDAELAYDDVILNDNDQNFVYKVYQRAPAGTKLKLGALDAFGGDAAVWKDFIENKIRELHHQDQLDYIEREKQKGEEEGRRAEAVAAKKDACHKIPVVAVASWLLLPDDDFIRELLKTPELADPAHREIKNAANAALIAGAADWTRFIVTGIGEARARDDARILREREEADRQKVRDIKTKADASRLRPRLSAAAASVAATGTWDQVKDFLARGQYLPLEQGFSGVTLNTRGWHVRSGGGDAWATPGTQPANTVTAPLGEASWKVVTGLADANCFSLESATRVGSYLRVAPNLRVQLAGNDGTDGFKLNATWCARPGLDNSAGNVSLQSKAHPGRYLRQYWGELWAAHGQSAENNFDTTGNYATDASWKTVDPNPNISTKIDLRLLNEDWWREYFGPAVTPEYIENGVRVRKFQNGAAFWNPSLGPKNILFPILTKYWSMGGHKVPANLPVVDNLFLPDGVGRATHLESGRSIYWSPSTDSRLIFGAIRELWEKMGWERSWLGYPISDEMDVPGEPGKRRSMFQFGNIDHTAQKGAWAYAR